MDIVFSKQIGNNQEVYINDMIVKTSEAGSHIEDLKDTIGVTKSYSMHMNLAKCSFGIQEGKFSSLVLTKMGIKANLDE